MELNRFFPGEPDRIRSRTQRSLLRILATTSPAALCLLAVVALQPMAHPVLARLPLLPLLLVHGALCGFNRRLGAASERSVVPWPWPVPVLACVLLGSLWGVTLCLPDETGIAPLRLFLLPTVIYAGVLLAPNLAGGLGFIVAVGAIAMLGARTDLIDAADWQILAASCTVFAAGTLWWRHREFRRDLEDRAELEQHGETVDILLNDFGGEGASWLWETDREFRLVTPSDALLATVRCSAPALSALSLRRWIAVRERRGGNAASGYALLGRAIEDRESFRNVRVMLARPGDTRWLLLTGKPIRNRDGEFLGYRGIGSDVTAAEHNERELAWLARHDSLTRLPNRAYFHAAVSQSCEDTMVAATTVALLCLDLDGFKEINDTLGHPAGDALLIEIAARLQNCLRSGDMAGRLGGDEFAILMHDADLDSAQVLAARVLNRISEPCEVEGETVRIGVSIGIMVSAEGGSQARALFKGADTALYEAKQAGRGTVRVFPTGPGSEDIPVPAPTLNLASSAATTVRSYATLTV